MVNYWDVTRTPYARSVYETLKRLGITATRMYEYRGPVAAVDRSARSALADGIRITRVPPRVHPVAYAIDFSRPVEPHQDEWVLVATEGTDPVARLLVSDAESHYIEALERPRSVDGAYIRRVFVVPGRRGRGIASALLEEAMAVVRDELDVDTATALIAADNRPSQLLFERQGFRRVERHEYARVGPLSHYRRRPVTSD